jgi:excisionase family DNA binding protein
VVNLVSSPNAPSSNSNHRNVRFRPHLWRGVPSLATSSPRPRLLTPNEVAEQLRVSTMTVYRLIKSGELPAARISRSYRLREADVDAYLESRFSDAG